MTFNDDIITKRIQSYFSSQLKDQILPSSRASLINDKSNSTNGDRSSRSSARSSDTSQQTGKNPNVADIPDTDALEKSNRTSSSSKGLQRVGFLVLCIKSFQRYNDSLNC